MILFKKMEEYYSFYLSLHQHPKCRLLHFVGQWITLGIVVAAFKYSLWLFLVAPFIIYPFAWLGHILFEKNRPLAWEGLSDWGVTTLKAKVCDWLMFMDILKGKLKIW